jgi:hypothetical protein
MRGEMRRLQEARRGELEGGEHVLGWKRPHLPGQGKDGRESETS